MTHDEDPADLWRERFPDITRAEADALGAVDHIPSMDFTGDQLLAAYRSGAAAGRTDQRRACADELAEVVAAAVDLGVQDDLGTVRLTPRGAGIMHKVVQDWRRP